LPSGEFFVADGYCNSRVIKYTKAGIKISEWKAGKCFAKKFHDILFVSIILILIAFITRNYKSYECSSFANIGTGKRNGLRC
jgi:hypothetical protein